MFGVDRLGGARVPHRTSRSARWWRSARASSPRTCGPAARRSRTPWRRATSRAGSATRSWWSGWPFGWLAWTVWVAAALSVLAVLVRTSPGGAGGAGVSRRGETARADRGVRGRTGRWLVRAHAARALGAPRLHAGRAACAFRVLPGVRATVAANQAQVLGRPVDDPLCGPRTRQAFERYARYWFDTFHVARLSDEELTRRFHVDGVEHMEAAHDAGKGLVMVMPHMGNWDVGGRWMSARGRAAGRPWPSGWSPSGSSACSCGIARISGMDIIGTDDRGRRASSSPRRSPRTGWCAWWPTATSPAAASRWRCSAHAPRAGRPRAPGALGGRAADRR